MQQFGRQTLEHPPAGGFRKVVFQEPPNAAHPSVCCETTSLLSGMVRPSTANSQFHFQDLSRSLYTFMMVTSRQHATRKKQQIQHAKHHASAANRGNMDMATINSCLIQIHTMGDKHAYSNYNALDVFDVTRCCQEIAPAASLRQNRQCALPLLRNIARVPSASFAQFLSPATAAACA